MLKSPSRRILESAVTTTICVDGFCYLELYSLEKNWGDISSTENAGPLYVAAGLQFPGADRGTRWQSVALRGRSLLEHAVRVRRGRRDFLPVSVEARGDRPIAALLSDRVLLGLHVGRAGRRRVRARIVAACALRTGRVTVAAVYVTVTPVAVSSGAAS